MAFFRKGPKKPGQREVWRDTAGRLKGEYLESGKGNAPRIRLRHDPWLLTLDNYTVSNGQTSVTYTRLQEIFSGSKLPDLLRRYPKLRLDVKAPTRKVRKKHGERLFKVVVVTVGVVKDPDLIGGMFAIGMSSLDRLAAVHQATEEVPPDVFRK